MKFTLEQATKAQRDSSYNSTLSLTSALDGGEVNAMPRPFTPGKETRYRLYRRLGGLV